LLGIAGLVLLGLAGQREDVRERRADEVKANLPPSTTTTAEAPASPATPDEVKAKAQTIAYESLAREPSKYTGTTVTFTGKVIQVQESGRSVTLRVDVTKGPFGSWSDTIYVEYRRTSDTEPRILEGDIIRLYGDFKGLKSYKAIMGQTITIPRVVAGVVERETSV
jgi:hypothetical protein